MVAVMHGWSLAEQRQAARIVILGPFVALESALLSMRARIDGCLFKKTLFTVQWAKTLLYSCSKTLNIF